MSLDRKPPQRLKDTHPGLRELSERSFSKERLDANRVQLEDTIQSGFPSTGLTSKVAVTGMSAIALLTVTSLWLTMNPSPQEQEPSQTHTGEVFNPQPVQAPQKSKPILNANNLKATALEADGEDTAARTNSSDQQKPSEQEGKFKSLQKAPLRASPTGLRKSTTSPSPKANLGEEIESFQKAKAYFESRDYGKARQTLEELQANFNDPKLRLEISLLLIQTRFAMEEKDAALSLLQKLMREPNAKPQAQWYKLLGDIQKSRGQCGRALIAYSKAMKIGLSAEQSAQVSLSVRACSTNQ